MLVRLPRQARRGLTLIELVVVLVILIGLAALLVPKLGFLQQQANNATGAATSADLMNNLETFRVSSGYYPTRFDSLLSGTTVSPSIWANPGVGFPYTTSTTVFSDPYAAGSFGMTFGTAFSVVDQDAAYAAPADSNSSFNTPRAFTFSGDALAIIGPPGNAFGPSASPGMDVTSPIWQAAGFASTTPYNPSAPIGSQGTYTAPASATGVTLVAFGVGPQSAAVGQTMSSPPLQIGQQPPNYGRFVAVFAVYGTGSTFPGKGAELKLVLDSFQQTISGNVSLYRQAGPVDQ